MLENESVTIRMALVSDTPNLCGVYNNARVDDLDVTVSEFEEVIRGEKIYLATEYDIVAGFISLWLPESYIHHLFVHSNYQGRGMGTELLARALLELSRPVSLKCLKNNVRALALYERLGWEMKSCGEDEQGEYWLLVLDN